MIVMPVDPLNRKPKNRIAELGYKPYEVTDLYQRRCSLKNARLDNLEPIPNEAKHLSAHSAD
jgi:hypothetical protein